MVDSVPYDAGRDLHFSAAAPDGPPPAGCATGRHVPRGLLPPAISTVTELARKIETRWISILIGSIAPSILSGHAATVAVVAGAHLGESGVRG